MYSASKQSNINVAEKKEKQCDANLPFQFTVLKTNLLVCFFLMQVD